MRFLFLFTVTVKILISSNTLAEMQGRPLPNPHEYFYDEVGVFSSSFKKKIEYSLKKHQQLYQKRISVLFLESLRGESIESFAFRFIEKLSLEINIPTAILIVSVSDRKIRVEPNAQSQKTWHPQSSEKVISAAAPFFKERAYEQGVLAALNQMATNFGAETKGPGWFQKRHHDRYNWAIIATVLFFIFLFGRGRKIKESWFYYKNKDQNYRSSKDLAGRW